MKVKKIAGTLFGILAVLFLLVLCIFLFWLGPTVKLVAETIGSKALGTPLTIEKLSINPRKGTIHLTDFAIANPDAFGRSNAVSLASLDVSIDMGSIFSRTVTVHEVSINSPYFIYEQSSATDNIQQFILNVQDFIGYDSSAPPPPPDPKELEKERRKQEKKARKKKEKGPKVVLVEWLEINDLQMHLANTEDNLLDFNLGFEKLSLSMTNGAVQLDRFFVSNPGRLETPNLFELEQFEVLTEPGSVYSTNITVHAVNIRKPHAFIEQNPDTDTFEEFLAIASALAARIPTNTPPPEAAAPAVAAEAQAEPETPPAEVQLDTLLIEEFRVHVLNMGDPKLDVQLGLDQLKAALGTGDISLEHLFLSNPKRLETPHLFALDRIGIKLSPESLKSETLVVEDVQVDQPHAFLELNPNANTTGEFMKIVNGFLQRVPDYPSPQFPTPEKSRDDDTGQQTVAAGDAQKAPPLELHNLQIHDIQIQLMDSTPTNHVPDEPYMIAGIEEIAVRLTEGVVQINEITIPNAKGFYATNLFHLAHIDITIQPESVFSDQVVIDSIYVNAPRVDLEQTEDSGNVAHLQTTLTQFAPPPSPAGNTPEPAPAAAPVQESPAAPTPISELPVVLHQLVVTNLAVHLKLPETTNKPSAAAKASAIMDVSKLNPLAGSVDQEDGDPNAPMTLVAFNRLTLEPLKGLFEIDGIRLANPPGFSRKDLVNIESFRIDMNPDTLQQETLLIEDILIARPRVRYERQIMGDNVKALQEEIEQATVRRREILKEEKPETLATPAEAVAEREVAAEERKVIIEHLLITDGMVQAKLSALPSIPVPLPKIELANIGKEEGGTSVAEASTKIFDTFYNSMIGAIGNTTGFAGDTLKGVGSLGMNALGSVTDGVSSGLNKAAEESKELAERITGGKKSWRGAGGRKHFMR